MDLMRSEDPFFAEFGRVDDLAMADGAISTKHKELTMVAISIVQKCDECIAFHVGEARAAGASRAELVDAVKIGLMAGGSTGYPYARRVFQILEA